ncbi:MAG: maleylpyruvate isomerase N-terminal domain-containing protein [Actinomycetota bacterium]|nr:maleylpyruvate isomerase N-terminal domain-containing protein [Actinomycetota bacterium]MDA2971098.1 maleylpyruvate isomerase N-terminal domain-containing protein [Actinomycetota bacterium]MDA3002160.1 maleylpyruvate isomerase N-terminal domain-containing protein [Actinomycetota bacterium]
MTDHSFDPVLLNRRVEGLAASHQRVLKLFELIDDGMLHRSSMLPEWTVGHVLAHLEQNARAMSRMIEAAERGDIAEMYPGGVEARSRAIDSFSGRSADEHRRQLRQSIYELEGWFARAREGWYGFGRSTTGVEIPIVDLPLRRWREVEVHLGDLGLMELGPTGPSAWSEAYVRDDLAVLSMQWKARGSMGLTDLPSVIATRVPRERLAWLLGRLDVDGLAPAGVMA